MRTWNIHNAGKTLYIWDLSRVVELLLQVENKQQIVQNYEETQHKHMCSLSIGSFLLYETLSNTSIVTSQVFVEILMR